MPWTQKQMLRDANGDLIPQYWDVVEQEFKPLTGSDGANDVRLTGSKVVLYTGSTTVPAGAHRQVLTNITFDEKVKSIDLVAWANINDTEDYRFKIYVLHHAAGSTTPIFKTSDSGAENNRFKKLEDVRVFSGRNHIWLGNQGAVSMSINYEVIVRY